MPPDLVQQRLRRRNENPCIPVVLPGQKVPVGGFEVRFLHELENALTVRAAARGALPRTPNVAVTGFRTVRDDPQGDDASAAGQVARPPQVAAESPRIRDEVIGRQESQRPPCPRCSA